MLTLAYYACDTILTGVTITLFANNKSGLCQATDANGRKTLHIRSRVSEIPRILQAALLPQNNAVDDLVGQLNAQTVYARTCITRHEEGIESCKGAKEDMIELLDELTHEVLQSAFLVHGFADIYPGILFTISVDGALNQTCRNRERRVRLCAGLQPNRAQRVTRLPNPQLQPRTS